MNTGNFITVNDVLFKVAGFAGDMRFEKIPYGFYIQLISDAFEELNMDTMLMEERKDFPMPMDHLTIPLPSDCFNVRNVYVFTGDKCNISASKKVWHKRNYYTTGNGYIANRTGNKTNDPFYGRESPHLNDLLYFNVQNGNLMLSASCRGAGTKVHIHYNSTGCEVKDAPIIPRFYKTAMEDFCTEAAIRFRMANEPDQGRALMAQWQIYDKRLDKAGFNGSWHDAVTKSTSMSNAEKESLSTYLQKGAWATGR